MFMISMCSHTFAHKMVENIIEKIKSHEIEDVKNLIRTISFKVLWST